MVDCYIICGLFVLMQIVYGTPYIKGLYCQDPDTKKLYPVNSTWRSETFCGNYTCKLRKKNLTETEYVPITINITSQQLKDEYTLSNDDDMSVSPSENSIIIEKIDSEKQPAFHRSFDNKMNELKEELKNNKSEVTDRYLTESEIQKITEILRSTIKKSDLEAIVEIYNVAQEIHKELNIAVTEKTDKDTVNSQTEEIKKQIPSQTRKDSISYWYEPLHHNNGKHKPVDLKTEGTNVLQTAYPYLYPESYVKRPLQEREFRKLPYYYPTSSFHRTLSYLHNPYKSIQNSRQETLPCNKDNKSDNSLVPVWYNPIVNNNQESYKKSPATQPMMLPYPFSYVHHNFTNPASYYYSNYPWAQLNAYNRNKQYPQPYYGSYAIQEPRTAIIVNPDELEGKYDDQVGVRIDDTKTKNKELPEWQTEPLSEQILDEVKANMLEKSKIVKPLSLRKTLKLEKVGKVIKLDDLARSKRDVYDVSDNGLRDKTSGGETYETYIEKTMCESSLEPGYFSVGNETEPYPECCPRRINS